MQLRKQLLLAILLTVAFWSTATAQQDKSKRPSPPASIEETIDGTKIAIRYSQPATKGRTIWGDLVPYGKVWRTGANEATTFAVDEDVLIQGEPLPAGKYALFTIPGKEEWTFIFNKVADQWGAYNYDPKQDALRVTAKPETADDFAERLMFYVNQNGRVRLHWADLTVSFRMEKN